MADFKASLFSEKPYNFDQLNEFSITQRGAVTLLRCCGYIRNITEMI